jgi:hypothetical protein
MCFLSAQEAGSSGSPRGPAAGEKWGERSNCLVQRTALWTLLRIHWAR